MARAFQHEVSCASVRRLRDSPLDIEGLRCRVHIGGWHNAVPFVDARRGQKTAPLPPFPEQLMDVVACRGLAVGAGDSDERYPSAWMGKQRVRGNGIGMPHVSIGEDDERGGGLQIRVSCGAHDKACAARYRLADEVLSVEVDPLEGEIGASGSACPGVMAQCHDVIVAP